MQTVEDQMIQFSDPNGRVSLIECMQIVKPLKHGDRLKDGTKLIGSNWAIARSGCQLMLINTRASQPKTEWCMCDTCEPGPGVHDELKRVAEELMDCTETAGV